jgi:phosphoribosylamine--glycine ligase
MRILIVGNGGREHALLWKLRRDDPSAELFATRPNGGMAPLCEAVEIAATDVEALSGWAAAHRVDLTIVGPEGPLAAGIVDRFQAKGLPIFGPTAAAARIEASKAYAKDLMRGAGVPTAEYRTFSNRAGAEAWVRERGAPIVVKASGLAAGKGAIVCGDEAEAVGAIGSMLGDLDFGEAGREVVIEEFMEGEELSLFAIADGDRHVLLVPSQDHKRVGEGDEGPNTGGMGAYAPVGIADGALVEEAERAIIKPTLRALAADGAPFRGLLYAGVMKTDAGLRVVEFNCRFGDPEAEVLLPRLRTDLLAICDAIADQRLEDIPMDWDTGATVGVVMASGGYPGAYATDKVITGVESVDGDVQVFFSGAARDDAGRLVTSGGRVLCVVARGETVAAARERAYDNVRRISFEGAHYRTDIGATADAPLVVTRS